MNPCFRLNAIIEAAFQGPDDKVLTVTYENTTVVIEDKVTGNLVRLAAADGVTFDKAGVDGLIVLKPGVWTFKINGGYIADVQPAPKAEANTAAKTEAKPRKTSSSTPASSPFRKAD